MGQDDYDEVVADLKKQKAQGKKDAAALKKAIAIRLGADPFGDGSEGAIEVHLDRSGSHYHARVVQRNASGAQVGERRLAMTSRLCADLIPALALTIALALEPSRRPKVRRPALRVREGPRRRPRLGITDRLGFLFGRADFVTPPKRLSVSGRLGLLAFVGTAPNAAVGLGVALVLRYGRFATTVELRGHPGLPYVVGATTLYVSQAVAAVQPCWRTETFGLCLSVVGGFTHARATGVDAPKAHFAPSLATGLRVDWRVMGDRRLGLWLYAEGDAELIGARLLVSAETLWKRPPISGTFGVAVGTVF